MLKEQLPKIITDKVPGPKAEEVIRRREDAVPSAIKCVYPVVIKRAEGAVIEDVDENYFLDWTGGVGVLNVGFSHPEVVEAVKEQSEKYFHGMFNIVTHEGYVKLAEKMNSIVPVKGNKKKTFFANSGAEADENAVKIAKAFTNRPNIVVFSGAFHGRTVMTMAMTSKKSYAYGMGPFPDGVYRAEFPYLYRSPEGMPESETINYYIESIKKVFDQASPPEYVAAIVVEPLQGEGGFIPAPIEWVKAVRTICDKYGILLVADEVQCGFCRTGKMFASEYWKEAGAAPDIIATAKSIAAGMPLSAITAREEIMEAVRPGTIGGTFCGNAVACAAALKVIEIMERDHLADRSMEIGKKVMKRYMEWKEKYEIVGDVRGLGGMVGIEFVKNKEKKDPNPEIVSAVIQEAAQNGLMIENSGVYGNVIRFLAPLVITDKQLEAGLDIFEKAISKCMQK
ncbi:MULTISPECIES: aspartate aminotransferase family protein [Clostridium]|uniref:(S)-3-amino-2-methylpropionate transaminase n=2 Tax=Clostridium TaxID=1485 RepID=D8GJ34_CLOLD|nr:MULTISPECIES: aspartate aminotransferase family protein [Clostridium]ADK15109.1 4-aminobutyrate aminotransferase [Clostridium ljungdahlii DSM 13528]AGY74364.1 aspartate aminotransferase family protein [Clostridium autoethanogenum DSM 10061]ALU34553.1 (S)-3-amino-2-methylpropionate transaminase [Clostridium autoethanogenum DSM 10061]OAA83757.1 5-aminovalerate aminotransferase DavT [Clostridium ljungdahlii DSM 13528]OVY51273.1 5-aminovalerate aminotransferase DavT [Clostridium autoethanogenum